MVVRTEGKLSEGRTFPYLSGLMSALGLSSLTSTQRYPAGATGVCGAGAARLVPSTELSMPFLMAPLITSYVSQTPINAAITDSESSMKSDLPNARSNAICEGVPCQLVVMNQPAQAYYNRLQWLELVAPLMLQAANAACQKALRAAQKGAPLAGEVAQRASLSSGAHALPTLPVGNHGEMFAKGQSL